MEPDRLNGALFTSTPCTVAIATDEETGVSHVAATLPGGTYVLTVASARALGMRLMEGAFAAEAMNTQPKGGVN